ncbi:MAG: sugar nucleotide-binding protein [Oligoflexia bacterium]|nr:sugar nucleotide-binding protein [Oligoflexia bacterium]
MPKSVLIVGGSGFLGTHLGLRLREEYRVYSTYLTRNLKIPGVSNLPLDVGNRALLRKIIGIAKPDVIVYLVNGGPDLRDMVQLEKLHTEGAANITNVPEASHSHFIYLSSAMVFDGSRGNYRETDASIPNTLLGRAKVSGENFLRSRSTHMLVIRSSPVFGRGNPFHLSTLDRIRMSLDRGRTLELNDHHLHSFAPVTGLVDVLSKVISSMTVSSGPAAKTSLKNRTLHYGGLTKVSLAEFARVFAKRYRYDPKLILPQAISTRAARTQMVVGDIGMSHPGDFSLNSSATIELLKTKPFLLEEGFDLIDQKLVVSLG